MSTHEPLNHSQVENLYVEIGHLGHALKALFAASDEDDVPPDRMKAGGWLAEMIADRAQALLSDADAKRVTTTEGKAL